MHICTSVHVMVLLAEFTECNVYLGSKNLFKQVFLLNLTDKVCRFYCIFPIFEQAATHLDQDCE